MPCEIKYITLLDLARQSKIITGDTACLDGKIQAGIPFSGYPTGVDLSTSGFTNIVGSSPISADAVFSGSSFGGTGTTIFDVSNVASPNFNPIFTPYTATTWDNTCTGDPDACSVFSAHTSELILPITPFFAGPQTVGPFWFPSATGMTGEHMIITEYTGCSITYSFYDVVGDPNGATSGGGGVDPTYTGITGFTTAIQLCYSANSLDYRGPLDYLRSREDATVDNELTTKKLKVTGGASSATIDYVLTQVDEFGTAEWRFNSSTASTNTFVTSGILNGSDELVLTWNTGGSVPPIDLSALKFTGGSGDCIDELYVNTISACTDAITLASPVESSGADAIGDNSFAYVNNIGGFSQARGPNSALLGGNLQNTSIGGINSAIIGGSGNTVDFSNSAIIGGTGITASQENTVYMNNLVVTQGDAVVEHDHDEATSVSIRNFDPGTAARTIFTLSNLGPLGVQTNGQISLMGPNFVPFGTFLGEFLPNSLNITTAGGTFGDRANINIGSRRGLDSATRFFGGSSNFNAASLLGTFFLSGLTLTDSYSGGLLNAPKLRVRDGATTGFVLTATDDLGNAAWEEVSFSGGSGNCITDLYVTNIHGCSPITIHDPTQHISSFATGINSIAWGSGTTASGDFSHAEGLDTIAAGIGGHAEGGETEIDDLAQLGHAEGYKTYVGEKGHAAHAEGILTQALKTATHAEGSGTTADNHFAHAEGFGSSAIGNSSHAQGYLTTASRYCIPR